MLKVDMSKKRIEDERRKCLIYLADNLELLKDVAGLKRNLNLTYAVRDGILGHSGNPKVSGQKPRDEFVDLSKFNEPNKYAPYTWEACVVKIADNISYLGRDLEDAKEMKIITERDINNIDKSIENIRLNNSSIIGYLTGDLCKNSTLEEGLKFSDEAYETMEKIKKFNYDKIYKNDKIQPTVRYFTVVMNEIFYTLKQYYPVLSQEFATWLETYSNCDERDEEKYFNKIIYDLNDVKEYSRAIIDYMSGMTDQYIVRTYNEIISF